MKIKAKHNTILKKRIMDYSQNPSEKSYSAVEAGKEFQIDSYSEIDDTNHYKVVLSYGAGEWYIFAPVWELYFDKPESDFSSILTPVNWNDPNSNVSKYFKVAEVTLGDKRRIPIIEIHQNNILKLAKELDKIREDFGYPIQITSWYRPPDVNRAVGGVSNSQHITGNAVDIRPMVGNIKDFEKWLDVHWYGALGYGSRKGFVHLDMRNNKGWKGTGTKGVRWNYV